MRGYISALCFAFAAAVLADSTCYQRRSDQIIAQPNWSACANTGSSGVQLCCKDGDLCGQDSLCRSPDVTEGNEWYVGGCTDKTYKDKTCSTDCTSYKQSWATHNASGYGYWACCGNYDCADGPPTTRRFKGVSPSDWKQISQAGSSNSSSGGLSNTLKIVIGVVVAVVVVAIIAIAAFCLMRRKKGTKNAATRSFGRTTNKKYEKLGPQGDVLLQAPFVSGENQPYSRPSSPLHSEQAQSYSDGPHLPPGRS